MEQRKKGAAENNMSVIVVKRNRAIVLTAPAGSRSVNLALKRISGAFQMVPHGFVQIVNGFG